MTAAAAKSGSLKSRVLMAALFGPVILGLFYLRGIPLFVFFCLLSCAGQWEMHRMFADRVGPIQHVISYCAGIAICVDAFIFGSSFFGAIATLAVMLLMAAEVFRGERNRLSHIVYSLFAVFYPPLFIAYLIRLGDLPSLHFGAYRSWLYIVIILVVWMFDTASYFAGRAFGRHPFFPKSSPKKTVEGFIGGLIGAALAGVAAGLMINPMLVWVFAGLALTIAVSGQVGDLAESIIKREVGVKDSGIIPGHGGVLDRFDSLLFAGPAVYLYITVLQAVASGG